MLEAAAWKRQPEPLAAFPAGAARPDGAPRQPGQAGPGVPNGGPGTGSPGDPVLSGAGPAAIVSISPEAQAAADRADEPPPPLLGQRRHTRADNPLRLPGSGQEPGEPEGTGTGKDQAVGSTGKAEAIGSTGEAEAIGTTGQTGSNGVPEQADGAGKKKDGDSKEPGKAPGELSPDDQEMVKELQARDREVRAHEAAHLAAAGGISKSGASFSYQAGPDGRRYAVGGEVQIDTSPEKDPRATIAKARQIQAAASAPAQPSGQDRAVAAEASRMAAEAQAQLAKTGQEEAAKAANGGKDPHDHPDGPSGCEPCVKLASTRVARYA